MSDKNKVTTVVDVETERTGARAEDHDVSVSSNRSFGVSGGGGIMKRTRTVSTTSNSGSTTTAAAFSGNRSAASPKTAGNNPDSINSAGGLEKGFHFKLMC